MSDYKIIITDGDDNVLDDFNIESTAENAFEDGGTAFANWASANGYDLDTDDIYWEIEEN